MKVNKAVIVAAGWGTRFLPVTKSVPKEMMPLVDKPLIQYAVEEAVASGIKQIVLITSANKKATEDYFDRSAELERVLEKKGDSKRLEMLRRISGLADICYVRQKEQLGLGHAVLTAKNAVGDEPFAVMLPDDIIESDIPALGQMLEIAEKYKGGVIAVERVADEDTRKYGIIDPKPVAERVDRIKSVVEKPEPDKAPSRLGIVGRYILPPQIFAAIEETPPGKGGEIQLTDGIQRLLAVHPVFVYEFEGVRYDTGNLQGWLRANLALALKRSDTGRELRDFLKKLI